MCAQHIQIIHHRHSRGRQAPLIAVLRAGGPEPLLERLCRHGALPTALGMAVQVGSVVGALLFFGLVNYTSLFSE